MKFFASYAIMLLHERRWIPMEYYDFEVLKGNETIAAARSVAILDPRAAWSRVAELAKKVEEPGCRIRVTNEAHEMVILIGITAARRKTSTLPPERDARYALVLANLDRPLTEFIAAGLA